MRKSDVVQFLAACGLTMVAAYLGGSPMLKGYVPGAAGRALETFHTDVNRAAVDLSQIRVSSFVSTTAVAALLNRYVGR